MNEIIGGWDLSGITHWHSGVAFSTVANAFVAGYANDAPGIFNGDRSAIRPDAHKRSGWVGQRIYRSGARLSLLTGPVGFTIGSRNNLRGPNYVNQNLGLAKTFPVYGDKVNLKFRTDAFNAFNHASFDIPGADPSDLGPPTSQVDITSGVFGQINTTANNPRVLQFSLRLEF